MTFDLLHTERLVLRKVDTTVLEYVHSKMTAKEVQDFYGLIDQDLAIKEKEQFENGLHTFNKSYLYFQLLNKENKDVIGWCGYHTWYLDHDRAEIGYGIFQDRYKGKGLMSEAMERVLDHGFNEMKLHRVEAFVGEENIASLRLMKKFNFQKEGILKEHYLKNGVYEDSLVFGLVR